MIQSPCPSCRTVGFVRRTHVVSGDRVSIEYMCERCQHTWSTGADERVKPDRRRTSRIDRRKR
jgi:DnaJ-class molecular chaperone